LSGVCSAFYVDGDGDGYGVGVGVSQCGTTPPTGYANKAGDCCDSDKTAYPGSPTTSATADACGSYDYNCDGHETPVSNGPTNCGTPTCVLSTDGTTCVYTGGCTCAGTGTDACTWYDTTTCGNYSSFHLSFCQGAGGQCYSSGEQGQAGKQVCN
jgi:hypothetical protein